LITKQFVEVNNQVPSNSENPYFENDEELVKRVLERANNFSRVERQNLIISLIKQCETVELRYLVLKIPRLHRDFLTLLPNEVIYRILAYVHPKDLCSLVCVSKSWAEVTTDPHAWESIYGRLGKSSLLKVGLLGMASSCYMSEYSMLENAKKLYALTNWSKGVFTLKHIRAHPLGILCIAFDGKLIAVHRIY
jgi:hypothetical protein